MTRPLLAIRSYRGVIAIHVVLPALVCLSTAWLVDADYFDSPSMSLLRGPAAPWEIYGVFASILSLLAIAGFMFLAKWVFVSGTVDERLSWLCAYLAFFVNLLACLLAMFCLIAAAVLSDSEILFSGAFIVAPLLPAATLPILAMTAMGESAAAALVATRLACYGAALVSLVALFSGTWTPSMGDWKSGLAASCHVLCLAVFVHFDCRLWGTLLRRKGPLSWRRLVRYEGLLAHSWEMRR